MGKLFISYRRVDADFAHRFAEKLEGLMDGEIFIDRKIASDKFDEALEHEIQSCSVFLLCVTDNTFASERINKADDWIRREIALALRLNKPIVLALREYKVPPHPDELPDDIRDISSREGKPIHISYFDEGVERIARHCVDVSSKTLRLKTDNETPEPTSRTPITQSNTGNNNIQQAIGQANNSTIIGQQTTIDNRRQDALAKIETLRRDKQELINEIGMLQQVRPTFTMEGRIFQLGGALFALVIGFSINVGIGLIALAALIGFVILQMNASTSASQSRDTRRQQLQHKLHQIDAEIEQLRQIEKEF